MNPLIKTIILAIIFGGLAGGLTVLIVLKFQKPSQNELIKEFYLTENAVHVSPHSLRKAMDSGKTDFILVDLRSQKEYKKNHIAGAVNIPAYKDPDTSAYDETERIIGEFQKLPKDKEIIVYCYSAPCMTGRKIGKLLAENNIYVKQLGIGWNEWRYFWNLWNHEHEWEKTKAEDYITTGLEPGVAEKQENSSTCPIEGEFGC